MLKRALSLLSVVFSKPALEEGRAFFDQGQVLNVRLSDGLMRARVMGTNHQIHDVFLDLRTWPDAPSRCNCTKKNNCGHALACLMSLDPDRPASKVLEQPLASYDMSQPTVTLQEEDVIWYSQYVDDKDSPQNDFFSYELGILVDGKTVNLVPWMLAFIERFDLKKVETWDDQDVLELPMGQGRLLSLKVKRVRPFIRLLLHLGLHRKKFSEDIKVSRYQLMLLYEAEQAIQSSLARWNGTDWIKNHLRQLSLMTVEDQAPFHLKASLRDYQLIGLSWLNRLRCAGFSGVLADDMGLGKTIQTLALLQLEKEAGHLNQPSLILAPTSVIFNWKQECERFTPQLKIFVYHGTERVYQEFDQFDVVVSTYGLIQRDKRQFLKHHFHYLILDEAQYIKNTQTKTRHIVQQIKSNHRLCLTGTPLENHLGELWSLFHFLMPGLLGDRKQFRQFFSYPIEKEQNHERYQLLMKRVQPFLLRRTKNEVAQELPPKTETTLYVEFLGPQRDLYEMIRMNTEETVRDAIARQGLLKSRFYILDALLKLRQVCCDPRLLKWMDLSPEQKESAKLQACLELLDGLMDEKRTVLVFSQYTSMLTLIEEALIERQYPYLKLTGKTKNRQFLIESFQNGDVPIFLISLKAGGTGLNLTKADTVIHYDPWWNPAVENQATDRAHRIGQSKPVFVYRLIAKGTVEEKIMHLQQRKRELFEQLFNGAEMNQSAQLTEDDIEMFFRALSE